VPSLVVDEYSSDFVLASFASFASWRVASSDFVLGLMNLNNLSALASRELVFLMK
jgi:hypothetical protein